MDPLSFLAWRFYYFFRDPARKAPPGRVVVSPADGYLLYARRVAGGQVPSPIKKGVPIALEEWVGAVPCEGDGTLIGIQAVVLNNSVIGKDCLVGAGAVIIENKSFADRSVIFGSPAKAVREVSEDNVTRMRMSAEDYVKRGVQYKKELKRIG